MLNEQKIKRFAVSNEGVVAVDVVVVLAHWGVRNNKKKIRRERKKFRMFVCFNYTVYYFIQIA